MMLHRTEPRTRGRIPALLILLLGGLLTACGGNLTLDNPRNEGVTFTFDGDNTHSLGPGETALIDLEPGLHSVEVRDAGGTVLADTNFRFASHDEGIVHSGESTYLVWRQLYGLQNERKTLLNERWVEFDSVRAYGDIKVYPASWLFVRKNWDLGLEEELPTSQTLYMTDDFKIEAKVFRAEDFIRTYKSMQRKE
ncbi:MAG: hypothetical protein AAGN35_17050 [Bacteroidota bacterium]